jgi:outer membrane protein OmpA-like peptidoglycan-associated protein
MHTARTLSMGLAALFALPLVACKHGAHAEAKVRDDKAHAEAHADRRDEREYDAAKTSRTGVGVDRDLVTMCKLGENDTFFAFDSAEITPMTRDILAKVADCVNDGALKGKELELVGHADPRGSDAYNEELGMSRAEAVAAYLRDQGVAASKIEIQSQGEEGASDSAFEWPLERRVDIRVKQDVSAKR